jgi:hypothetical protein
VKNLGRSIRFLEISPSTICFTKKKVTWRKESCDLLLKAYLPIKKLIQVLNRQQMILSHRDNDSIPKLGTHDFRSLFHRHLICCKELCTHSSL